MFLSCQDLVRPAWLVYIKAMKRWLVAVVLVAALWPQAVKASLDDFEIPLFEADYFLIRTEDGYSQMAVTEKIVVNFPEFDQNHGILRALPTSYGDMPLNLRIESVTNTDQQAYQFSTYEEAGHLVLRIGDPNAFAHGQTIYLIDYFLENPITFYDSHDELFWNVNGTQWPQSFGEVIARLHVPAELASTLQDRQLCYTGAIDSRAQDCAIKRDVNGEGGVTITSTARDLAGRENLSLVVAWDDGTFTPNPWPGRWEKLRWLVGGLVPLIVLGEMTRRWYRYGRDPSGRGVIVPQYVPPQGISPLEADTILHEKLRTEAVSAGIIDLARRGYLTIHESTKKKLIGSKTDYELIRTELNEGLSTKDKAVLDLVFTGGISGETVKLADEANKLYSGVQKLQSSVPKDLTTAGYFRHDPNSTRTRYYVAGGLLTFLPFFIIAFAPWLAVGLIAGGIIVLLYAGQMPARTQPGVELRDHLLGLKDYIGLAEQERIRFHQSPEGVKQYGDTSKAPGKVKLFETLLPYAMLFGMEKNWAKQFEHLYKQPPEWYSGSRAFSAAHLANSVNDIQGQATRAFSPPSSSGSSGFSGGGGSGGGGGGGGGGGW